MGGAFKKSVELDAVIVFADEAGFSMVPCLKRMWAPVGKTPIVKHRNRWHRKVSVIGAMAIFPDGSAPQLLSDWHPDRHVKKEEAAAFLRKLLAHLAGRHVIVIWDKLQAHRSKLVRQVVADHPNLETHHLPSYAPDLNPVEMVWSLSKHHRMANHGIDDLPTLETQARRNVAQIGDNPQLLHACIQHAGLHHALNQVSAQ